MRWIVLAVVFTAFTTTARAVDKHTVQGILLKVDTTKSMIVVSCDAIPGYMDAMEMTFAVRDSGTLTTVVPGDEVRFTMVEQNNHEYAEHLQMIKAANYESEPLEAGRLTSMHRMLDPSALAKIVPIGRLVPDFALTDQAGETVHLAQFKGKVVALTFAYSRCPNPNYCFRLSNNLSQLKRRFHSVTGQDLILMTIVIAPEEDKGKALEHYADTWKADPATWRFLTGSLADVSAVAEHFGMDFWSGEGFLTHSFHTVVIDREGRLAANLEGNEFSAEQLGDLVEVVLERP